MFFALGWLMFVLSIGALSLLYWLIGNSSSVIVAWLLFGGGFSALALVGMGIAMVGVYLARK